MAANVEITASRCVSSVKVLSVLANFRRTKKFCDITLKCGERNFYAHSCVLAAVSPYFLGMFRSNMSEVYTQVKCVDLAFLSVSPAAVSLVLDYIYGEVIEIELENAFELLAVADYMLLNQLKTDVCQFLADNLSLEMSHLCFETRRAAEFYGCKKLYETANCFINAMFYRLSQTPSFLELNLGELESFLETDELSANEYERFESILRWVVYSRETRFEHLEELLNDYVQIKVLSKESCKELLCQYDITAGVVDIFDKEFFKTTLDESYEGGVPGRQGQEVILVFGNESCQAYTPGVVPWHPVTLMPKKREHFKVVTLNGFVYVIGGTIDDKITSTVWQYNHTYNLWKTVAPMLKTAASFDVSALNGLLYATGGPNPEYNMQIYDPLKDEWSFGTPMLVKRMYHCMVAFQDRFLVVVGGNTPTTESLYSVEKYDTHTMTWTYMPQTVIGRIEASAVAHNDKIYVVGGYSGSFPTELESCEVYSNATNEWSLIDNMLTPRRNAAVTIYHGNVYVLGGNSKKGLPNFEYFCETTRCWKTEKSGSFNSQCQCCTLTMSGKQICNLYEN
ncbi:kelch-like protein 12 [Dendronephthya gigantea]|uniref:kelch-like protein 12 n=1 Tax=Dendronephthya gigantea TaxID=151771 RepID=UPI00106934E4|nr:kelch-like protein 12 [Dendronephthya gigantea]